MIRKTVHLDYILHNFRFLQSLAGEAQVMAIVKADAYGHGMLAVSEYLYKHGVRHFAVAQDIAALPLAEKLPEAEVLIMGAARSVHTEELIQKGCLFSVSSRDDMEYLSAKAESVGKSVKVHIKIDTGMGRLGFMPNLWEDLPQMLRSKPRLVVKGIFSHLAIADEPAHPFTASQFTAFGKACDFILSGMDEQPATHILNTAGLLNFPRESRDFVRPGIGLYGSSPDPQNTMRPDELKSAMTIEADISLVKQITKGTQISYGCTWRAPSDGFLAVIPAGYGDGFLRTNSGKDDAVLCEGERYSIVGRVCMDQFMIFSTGDVFRSGMPVTLMGYQNGECITADEIAVRTGTVPHEILTNFATCNHRMKTTYSG